MTRTERAYTYTKQRVLDATYAGGDLLTEGEVAEALGVPVSAGEVEAVMETRALVERFAFAKAIQRGADITDAMRAEIARQEARAADGDLDGFVEADRAFHTLL